MPRTELDGGFLWKPYAQQRNEILYIQTHIHTHAHYFFTRDFAPNWDFFKRNLSVFLRSILVFAPVLLYIFSCNTVFFRLFCLGAVCVLHLCFCVGCIIGIFAVKSAR
jgi:hypothetical protein